MRQPFLYGELAHNMHTMNQEPIERLTAQFAALQLENRLLRQMVNEAREVVHQIERHGDDDGCRVNQLVAILGPTPEPCPACGGEGTRNEGPGAWTCHVCRGTGRKGSV